MPLLPTNRAESITEPPPVPPEATAGGEVVGPTPVIVEPVADEQTEEAVAAVTPGFAEQRYYSEVNGVSLSSAER